MTHRVFRRIAAAGIALFAVGCAANPGSGDTAGGFYSRLDEGADCRELFEIRNDLDPKDPDIPEMNEALREIGCYSIGSKRTDR